MRLDLLLAREPFPEVFAATLANYLEQQFGWRGEVRWRNGRNGRRDGFLVNDKLNLIFPPSAATEQLRALSAEYAYHPNPVHRLFQNLYVRYAVSRPWRWWLASAQVSIEPWREDFSGWVILGGNHSIRIVDLERDRCVVIRKIGFQPEFLNAAIDLRVRYPDLPGPRLLEDDASAGWYSEERIRGFPLNRSANAALVERTSMAARQAMASLYKRTAEEVPLQHWIEDRLERVDAAVAALPPVYVEATRCQIRSAAEDLANGLRNGASTIATVATAATHGDFQPANILIPEHAANGPVYLIDWEYSAVRCRWYDPLVFELRSRFPVGLAERVNAWTENEARRPQTLSWCGCGDLGHWSARNLVAAFLLDDLLLRVRENAIPSMRRESSGLRIFLDALDTLRQSP